MNTPANQSTRPNTGNELAEFLAIVHELGINPNIMVEALASDREAMRIIAAETTAH